MTRARPTAAAPAALAAASVVLCCGVASGMAAMGATPNRVAMALASAFLPYGALLLTPALRIRQVLAFAAAAGLLLLLAPSVLSDDLFRYLWDGRVLRAGIDPYAHAPADPALAALRDELWTRVNHPRVPTIYPPIAQGLFGLAGFVWHHPIAVKALALLAHLATIPLVARIADRGGLDPRAATLFALNPLALSESALGGHVDAVAALLLVAFALALATGRLGAAVAAVAMAAGVKLIGLLLAPLLWRRSRLAAVAALALGALCVLPLLGAGGDGAVGGFGQYARRWGGNAGAHAWVHAGVRSAVEATHGVGGGRVELSSLREPLARARGTALDPMASFQREKKALGDPAVLESSVLATLITRALIVVFLIALAFLWSRRGPPESEPHATRRLVRTARALILVGLLLSPQVHPWYLLWLLPFEALVGGGAGLVFSAVVWVAYAPLDGWLGMREWTENVAAIGFEHGLVWLVLLLELTLVVRVEREEAKVSVAPGVSRGV